MKINSSFKYATLAKDLFQKRSDEDLSLRTVATKTSIALATIHRMEAGAKKLDIETIISICNWLGKPVQYYLTPNKTINNGKKD